MHYSRIVAVAALAVTSVSAFPLGNRGLVTADAIISPADDLVKPDLAFDDTDAKKHYVHQGLFSPYAEASGPPSYVHVPGLISKYVKRAWFDSGILWGNKRINNFPTDAHDSPEDSPDDSPVTTTATLLSALASDISAWCWAWTGSLGTATSGEVLYYRYVRGHSISLYTALSDKSTQSSRWTPLEL